LFSPVCFVPRNLASVDHPLPEILATSVKSTLIYAQAETAKNTVIEKDPTLMNIYLITRRKKYLQSKLETKPKIYRNTSCKTMIITLRRLKQTSIALKTSTVTDIILPPIGKKRRSDQRKRIHGFLEKYNEIAQHEFTHNHANWNAMNKIGAHTYHTQTSSKLRRRSNYQFQHHTLPSPHCPSQQA